MVYLSIRQDETSSVVVEYILCDDCAEIPEEPEIDRDITLGSEPCEFCGAWNGEDEDEYEDIEFEPIDNYQLSEDRLDE